MNNIEMAKAYMEEAVRGIKTARLSLDDGGYAYCIRQCQEAVERDSLV